MPVDREPRQSQNAAVIRTAQVPLGYVLAVWPAPSSVTVIVSVVLQKPLSLVVGKCLRK